MKRLRKKLKSSRGLTLVEMLAAALVLSLLALMLQTGLFMAQNSYTTMTAQSESQLLLSTLTNLLSNELRYARNVETNPSAQLVRYTSVNYGLNTTISLNEAGQLQTHDRLMLSSGAYGNGTYRISSYSITYDNTTGVFDVDLTVTGPRDISNETQFSVRCLNSSGAEGGST